MAATWIPTMSNVFGPLSRSGENGPGCRDHQDADPDHDRGAIGRHLVRASRLEPARSFYVDALPSSDQPMEPHMLAAPTRTTHNLDGSSGTDLSHRGAESHPPFLSAPEERELAERIKAGDRLAHEQLVLAYRRLVFRIVREYKTRGISRDDLIQEGSVGLIRAAQNFDPPTSGFRFSTYAKFWIRAFIQRAISNDGSLVRLLASPDGSPGQFQTAENDLLVQEERAAVHAALRRLSPFEAWVIRERFGLSEWCSNPIDSSKRRKKAKAAQSRSQRSSHAKKAARPSASYYSRTHDKLSRDCGLSVHRLRLVEKVALGKLRSFLSPAVGRSLPPHIAAAIR